MLVWCSRAAACASRRNRCKRVGEATQTGRQDLQRHAPAERFLLRLVDHAHAAAADLPQNAEIAQPLQRPARRRLRPALPPRPREASRRPGFKSSISNSVGKRSRIRSANCGMLLGIVADRHPLALPAALEELLGQLLDRVAVHARTDRGVGRHVIGHDRSSCSSPGDRAPVPAFSRSRARM